MKRRIKLIINFFKQKEVQNILVILFLLSIIFVGVSIRLKGLDNLKDVTTGEYIPLALDPFYFTRIVEITVENGGILPEFDSLRKPLDVGWHKEISPRVIILMYNLYHKINPEVTLRYINIISPVIFFAFGIFIFFLLIKLLTKSNSIALLSVLFLSLMPSYLYRTMAGFTDHESIGMLGFFLTMLILTFSLKYLNKEKLKFIKIISLALLTGLVTAFSIASWVGLSKFLLMMIPLGFFILWLIKCKKEEYNLFNLILFYIIWIISLVVFTTLFGFPVISIIGLFLNTAGLLTLFVPLFMIVDYLIIKYSKKISKGILGDISDNKYRILYSLLISGVLGIIFLIYRETNIFSMLLGVWSSLLHPFGTGRLGLTVAENSQPFLIDWISQMGSTFFWMFIAGLVFFGIEMSKGIENKKDKWIFISVWVLMFCGILFSRISRVAMFDGVNAFSQIFYIFGILVLGYFLFRFYFKDKMKISIEYVIIFIWTFLMIISARSAIRFFFVITPFVCFAVAFFLVKVFKYIKENKEELTRVLLILLLVLGLIGCLISLNSFYKTSNYQATHLSPSANHQWQKAMGWVRENTNSGDTFAHWWDYGYWVQSLGERSTISDGGHFQGGFRDHMIGRYLLTNLNPASAMSFLKSNNVSYLLIDSTDLGKYPAYSKIGSNKEWDMYSQISLLLLDSSKTQETADLITRIYQGGVGVDQDIIYEVNGSSVLFPGPFYDLIGNPTYNSVMGGILFRVSTVNNTMEILQPTAVYIYNDQQIYIPLRYVYFQGELLDFSFGVEGIFYIFPKVTEQSIDIFGASLYLSPKVSKSLFAKMYLMDDVLGEYNLELVHSEPFPIVAQLSSQIELGDFIYYQGFRGPIKIWEVIKNEDILYKEEFTRWVGEWAEFDNLVVTSFVTIL